MAQDRKVFMQKNAGSTLYKWSPEPNQFNAKADNISKGNVKPNYCDATPGSQGQDWVTTYVYNLEVINYKPARIAYVECDYVQ